MALLFPPNDKRAGGTGPSGGAIRWSRWRDIPLAILAWTALVIIFFWLISHIVSSILLLIIASLLAYALSPAVQLLERFMPRLIAVLLVYIVVLGGIGFLGYYIFTVAAQQSMHLVSTLRELLASGNAEKSPILQWLHSIGVTQKQIQDVADQLLNQAGTIANSIVDLVFGFFTALIDIALVAIMSIYLMLDGPRVREWMIVYVPLRQQERATFLQNTIQRVVGGYIRGQFTMAVIIGVLVGIIVTLFHVPYAALLGLLAFILEFIPILGTLISGAVCVAAALSVGWLTALGVLVCFIGVHIIEGDILGPRIVGKAIGLHPVVAIFALTAGAELFGIWGALLASPVAGVIQSLLAAIWLEWRKAQPAEFPKAPPIEPEGPVPEEEVAVVERETGENTGNASESDTVG